MFSFKQQTAVRAPATETGAAVPEVNNSSSEGETFKSKAIAFAKQESEGMSEAINLVMKAKEDWQGGPIKVLFALQATYGEKLSDFPEPDSDTGNNPDKFKVETTDNAGKTAMRPTTFYTLFSDNTREGAAIVQELDWIARGLNPNAVKTGIPAEIMELCQNPQAAERRAAQLSGRRVTIRNSYKKAMALGFQFAAVNGVSGVVADFAYVQDKDGNNTSEVENTTKPIIVWVPVTSGPVKKWKHFSIGSFLKLDAKKAMEKGGGFANLEATLARANGGATGNGVDAASATIKTVDTFVKTFVETFRYMDEIQSAADGKDYGKLVQLLKHKDAGELVVAMVEYRNYLDDLCTELDLNNKYAELKKKGSDLVKKAA